jgi:hypothetical protein
LEIALKTIQLILVMSTCVVLGLDVCALHVVAALAGCALSASAGALEAPRTAKGNGRLHVQLQDAEGKSIAHAEFEPGKSNPAVLIVERAYQPGDRLVFGGQPWIALQVDNTMPECFVFAPRAASEDVVYQIPWGREEKETGSAYDPESFAGTSHRITMRALSKREISTYRNLALNPCDLARKDDVSVQFYPHASSNSVSRNLFDFGARNAIDGRSLNGHHGVWPYQSWGPELRTDIWWKLDLGRSVRVNKVRLMVRADFPHDSYWKNADLEFSDGSHVPLHINSSPEFQEFSFRPRRVEWMRIANPVPADPAKWCSLMEVEAWGKEGR